MRDGPVVIAVLEALRDGLTLSIRRDEAKLAIVAEALEVLDHRALHHDLVGGLDLDPGQVLVDRLRDHAGRVVPGHRPGLCTLQRPYGHAGLALLRHADQGVGKVGHTIALQDRIGRMRRTEGVP